MSQTPITVTYDIKKLIKPDKLETKFDKLETKFDKLETKIDKLDERVNRLELGMVEIKGKVEALDKRVENQEILNRITFGGVAVVIIGGAAKMFNWWPNP